MRFEFKRHPGRYWSLLLILLLLLGLGCLGGLLLLQGLTNADTAEFIDVDLASKLEADYRIDDNVAWIPGVRLDLLWDTIADRDPNATNLAARQAALENSLLTPVPTVTPPSSCRGVHFVYATQDTWLDSANPGDIHGGDAHLHFGREQDRLKQVLLYFPIQDVFPAGTTIKSARLEMDVAQMTGGLPNLAFWGLTGPFEETLTNWTTQPQGTIPYLPTTLADDQTIHIWDVTPAVRDWLSQRAPNNGLMLEPQTFTDFTIVYYSREIISQPEARAGQIGPRLVINCGGTLVTAVSFNPVTPTSTPTARPTDISPTTLPPQTPSVAPTIPPSPSVVPPTPMVQPTPLPTPWPTLPPTPWPTQSPSSPTASPSPTFTPLPDDDDDTPEPPPTSTPVQADVTISKNSSPNPVVAGETLVYTLTIANDGPSAAQNVSVVDNLPSNITIVDVNPPPNSQNGQNLGWSLGALANGATRNIVVTALIDKNFSGSLTNTATVSSATLDREPGSNSTLVTTTVLPRQADLSVTKVVDETTPFIGEPINYTLTIDNAGPSDAASVQLRDLLPGGLSYLSAITSQGSYNNVSGVWNVGMIADEGGATLTLVATTTTGGPITNIAQIIASDSLDPDSTPDNNLGSEDDQSSVVVTPRLPSLSINDVIVTEGDSGVITATFNVSLSSPTALPVSVNFSTANGTAIAPADYASVSGLLTFPPGVTQQTIKVPVFGDVVGEGDEIFLVNLSLPDKATIADGQGSSTIIDDDKALSPCATPVTTLTATLDTALRGNQPDDNRGLALTLETKPAPNERNSLIQFDTNAIPPGSLVTCATLLLEQISPPDAGQLINLHRVTTAWVEGDGPPGTSGATWNQSDKGAASNWATPGGDFEPTIVASFTPTATTHVVDIIGLTQFWVDNSGTNLGLLLQAQNLGSNSTVDFASREDGANPPRLVIEYVPTLSIGDVTIVEGNAGSTTAFFNVSLSSSTAQTVTVDYATADNTALISDSDYLATVGTLTFPPGTTVQTVAVTINGDLKLEGDETFFLNLSSPVKAGLVDGQGLGTIANDEAPALLIARGELVFLPVVIN